MAVVAEPTLRTVITVLAGIEAGSTVVPMSPDAGPRERDHVLADSGASLLVDRDGAHDLTPTTDAPSRSVPLVLYTSGTTGPPKGVPITQAAIDACLDGLADGLGLDSRRRPRPRPAPASRARPGPRRPRAPARRVGPAPHRAAHPRRLRRRRGNPVLRRADRVVAHRCRRGVRERAARRPPAGVRKRRTPGAGVRRAGQAVRPGTRGALRHDRDPHHPRRPRRRAAPARERGPPAAGHRGARPRRAGHGRAARHRGHARGARQLGLRRLPPPTRRDGRVVRRRRLVPDRRRRPGRSAGSIPHRRSGRRPTSSRAAATASGQARWRTRSSRTRQSPRPPSSEHRTTTSASASSPSSSPTPSTRPSSSLTSRPRCPAHKRPAHDRLRRRTSPQRHGQGRQEPTCALTPPYDDGTY